MPTEPLPSTRIAMRRVYSSLCLGLSVVLGPGSSIVAQSNLQSAPQPNTLSAVERAAGWRLLFDGKTTAGWRGYRMREMPPAWKVVDGVLMKESPSEDIVTTETFGDFELTLEWKVSRGGNSGLFYRATEEYDRVYWSAVEYQLLDDSVARDGRNRLTAAGAAYGFYAAPAGVVKGADQWNETRIVARGALIEHWLNGRKLFEFEIGSADFVEKYKASKFAPYENFAKARSGLIAIQGDHGGVLSLRNIKIRPLGG